MKQGVAIRAQICQIRRMIGIGDISAIDMMNFKDEFLSANITGKSSASIGSLCAFYCPGSVFSHQDIIQETQEIHPLNEKIFFKPFN